MYVITIRIFVPIILTFYYAVITLNSAIYAMDSDLISRSYYFTDTDTGNIAIKFQTQFWSAYTISKNSNIAILKINKNSRTETANSLQKNITTITHFFEKDGGKLPVVIGIEEIIKCSKKLLIVSTSEIHHYYDEAPVFIYKRFIFDLEKKHLLLSNKIICLVKLEGY